jgi:3-oxosteroid 1-dehydrogenase
MTAFRGSGGYGGVRFENWPAFWICDDQFRRNGYQIMGAADTWPAEDLESAESLSDLASSLGIDRAGLEATVARFNRFAVTGRDDDFGRGSVGFAGRANDEESLNRSLGSLTTSPFWGVRLQILGAGMGSHGVRIDPSGHVVDWRGMRIPGLFATGNAVAFTDHPFGYQDGLANARNIVYAFLGATTAAHERAPELEPVLTTRSNRT